MVYVLSTSFSTKIGLKILENSEVSDLVVGCDGKQDNKFVYLLWKVCSVDEGMGWCNGRIIGSSEDYGDHVELVHVKKLFRHIISTPAKI